MKGDIAKLLFNVALLTCFAVESFHPNWHGEYGTSAVL